MNTYDGFGTIVSTTGTATTGNGKLLREENPFRYASYFYDEETKLYYLRNRYYDPLIGRYLTRDIVPSANLYVYVENNPVRFVDPFGLHKKNVEPMYDYQQRLFDEMNRNATTKKSLKNVLIGGFQGAATASIEGPTSTIDPSEPSVKQKQRPFQRLGNNRYMRSPELVSDLSRFNLTAKYLAKFGALSFVTGTVFDFAMAEERNLITLRNAVTNNFFITGITVGLTLGFGLGVLGGIGVGILIGAGYNLLKEKTGCEPLHLNRRF